VEVVRGDAVQVGAEEGVGDGDAAEAGPVEGEQAACGRGGGDDEAGDAAVVEDAAEAFAGHAGFAEPEVFELVAVGEGVVGGAFEERLVKRVFAPLVAGGGVGDVGEGGDVGAGAFPPAASGEGGEQRVGAVAELCRDFLDTQPRVVGDLGVHAEGAAHGRGGDAGGGGDFLHGYALGHGRDDADGR